MSEENKSKEEKSNTQPDKNLAAEERPVPSQAEGDRQTVQDDLKKREKQ